MARIAVVGAASVGAFMAAQLSTTAHEVVACVRRPAGTAAGGDARLHGRTGATNVSRLR